MPSGGDWLALSFVQRAEDVTEARELAGGRAAILFKVEKPAAVDRFDDILAVSDGIMVARGDLLNCRFRQCPPSRSGWCASAAPQPSQ